MNRSLHRQVVLCLATIMQLAAIAVCQVAPLPPGAQTHWVVDQPQEIVVYLAFNPASVLDRIPSNLRFITIQELAAGGVSWAESYVATQPLRGNWGISFLEIIRSGTFTIDGRIVIGDGTAGFVERAKIIEHDVGVGSSIFYDVSVTTDRVIMSDGGDLEGTGVTADELVLPCSKDLAQGRDPVLSYAAWLVGSELSPEAAGKLFPVEWEK